MQAIQQSFEFLVSYPLLLVGMAVLPLLLLAAWRRVYPTRRLLALAAFPVATSLLTGVASDFIVFVLILDGLLLLLALFDLTQITSPRRFQVGRVMDRIMSLGKPSLVKLELLNQSRRRDRLAMIDDYPEEFSASPRWFEFVGEPRSHFQFEYELRSSVRGLFRMHWIFLRVRSRLGLWDAYYRYAAPAEIHVYPDLKQISEFGVLARSDRLNLLGVRRTRKIGSDNEFERLRDYSRDDNHRHIDWRATARKRKLIVRDYQMTQNQNVVFLVDCGRMMTGFSGGITLLDHAFNAMLMMSYVALRQSDAVGLLTFSDKVHSYTPPKTGSHHVNRLLHACFDQRASYVESRYDQAFLYLNRHCRKRSLVIVITNVIDQVNAAQIDQYAKNAAGRHLPLVVLLRDHDLFAPVDNLIAAEANRGEQVTGAPLFQAAVAAEIIRWRQQALRALTQAGVLSIDCFPEQLTSTLINRYLEIKARHLL